MKRALPLLLILALLPACGGSSDNGSSQARKDANAAVKRAQKKLAKLRRKLDAEKKQQTAPSTSTGTSSAPTPVAPTSTGTSTACPAGLVREGTQACVKPGGVSAGCGGDQYSTPKVGGGCIGPAHPPSKGPAKPQDCPKGQVPVGVTGACAPK